MRSSKHYLGLALAVIALVFSRSIVHALEAPPTPIDRPIVDQTNTLSEDEQSTLAATIAQEQAKSGNQIGILIIPTLAGDSLEDYSIRVARGWGIGTKEHNNGVLLLIVKGDRKLRIEVGYGLEGALPDATASQIIRNQISPQFRQGQYYEGISAGLQSIIAAIHNEYHLDSRETEEAPRADWETIIFVLFGIPIWLSSILARSRSWWAGGIIGGAIGIVLGIFFGFMFIGLAATGILALLGLFFDWAGSSNFRTRRARGQSPSWWAGGTRLGGGGSSGGFGGFGGGSFGGGGSSGSW